MRRLRVLWCGSLLCAAGCYSYAAAPVEQIPRGAAVRAQISAEEAERLRALLGHSDRTLEGKLLGEAKGGILLSVPAAGRVAGQGRRLYQRVVLPEAQLVEIEVRRLEGWKTGGLIAAAAVLAGVVVAIQFDVLDPAPPPPTPPSKGGNAAVIPWHP